eukprot:TRINITY_DN4485_c0_g6_i1.p1 TRINITY_DN4485_c0_g6~~TRINITY_DN4485_c0_g6_i1.p1  ORF type:complete len:272 (+),score=43.13 TRINITY_DN4485_c0_g6_i1:159-974(+)
MKQEIGVGNQTHVKELIKKELLSGPEQSRGRAVSLLREAMKLKIEFTSDELENILFEEIPQNDKVMVLQVMLNMMKAGLELSPTKVTSFLTKILRDNNEEVNSILIKMLEKLTPNEDVYIIWSKVCSECLRIVLSANSKAVATAFRILTLRSYSISANLDKVISDSQETDTLEIGILKFLTLMSNYGSVSLNFEDNKLNIYEDGEFKTIKDYANKIPEDNIDENGKTKTKDNTNKNPEDNIDENGKTKTKDYVTIYRKNALKVWKKDLKDD